MASAEPHPFENIISFDLETTGLESHDRITCAGIVGPDYEIAYTFGPNDSFEENRAAIVDILNKAPLICMYNGASFDIPFMQRFFGLNDETVGFWMLKLVDPLYAARGLLGTKACEKLNVILALNGLQPKTSHGLEAVNMAREGRWDDLKSYCLSDTRLTRELILCKPVYWASGLKYAPLTRGAWIWK